MIQNRYAFLLFLLFGALGQAQADPEARFQGRGKPIPFASKT